MPAIECVIQSVADLKPLLKRSFSTGRWPLAWNYAGRGRQKNLLFYLGLDRLAQQQGPSSEERSHWWILTNPLYGRRCHTTVQNISSSVEFWESPETRIHVENYECQGSKACWWADQGNLLPYVCANASSVLMILRGWYPLPYCTSNSSDALLMKVNHRRKASHITLTTLPNITQRYNPPTAALHCP